MVVCKRGQRILASNRGMENVQVTSGNPDTDKYKLPLNLISPRCDASAFDFDTTAEITAPSTIPGQSRAMNAVELGLSLNKAGYNLFAIGPEGVGKHHVVQRLANERAAQKKTPREYCYVNNFADPRKPIFLELPAGVGQELKDAMSRFVVDVKAALTAAFSGEDYRNAIEAIQRELAEQQRSALEDVREAAESRNIALLRTPLGFGLAPVREGKAISPADFKNLSEAEQKSIKSDTAELEQMLQAALQKLPIIVSEAQKKTKALHEKTAEFAVRHLIDAIKSKFADLSQVSEYLDGVEQDVINNAEFFLEAPDRLIGDMAALAEGPTLFWRYRINLLVDHGQTRGAPVVFEDEPTMERLLGRIEHRSENGTLVTDFNLIRAGSLHRANGGYLLIDIRRLLRQPLAWEALKRVLESSEIRIESLPSALGISSTVTLEPRPVPLEVKIVLFGDRLLYYLLANYDPDLRRHFKILADFDEEFDRHEDNLPRFASLIADLAQNRSLRPFGAAAVARLVDYSARFAGDNEKLSADFEQLADLMTEADFLADDAGSEFVTPGNIDEAYRSIRQRNMRLSDRLQEAILRNRILIDTEKKRIGQINGLSVYNLGGMLFGKPSRITARVHLGRGNVVDIEREVELGGPIHSKGVLILSGFLGARYAQESPLSLSASLVFEQSYGGVDGDSASAAELLALLSALAEVPLSQSIAITGSVNQHGDIQAIGGVNEKIEGFFEICKARGLNGEQAVIIPSANSVNLVLDEAVESAVAQGQFAIYGISGIDQGIELLTGMAAGELGAEGTFPEETFNGKVHKRLADMAKRRRDFALHSEQDDASGS